MEKHHLKAFKSIYEGNTVKTVSRIMDFLNGLDLWWTAWSSAKVIVIPDFNWFQPLQDDDYAFHSTRIQKSLLIRILFLPRPERKSSYRERKCSHKNPKKQ